jgi:hypothetical protein
MERYRQDPEYHARYDKQVVEYQKKIGPEYRVELNKKSRVPEREAKGPRVSDQIK